MRANTATHYGSVAKSLHWLTVLLIFTLIPTGIMANGLPFDTSEELARKAFWFSIHKSLGILLIFVALARILWAVSQSKPMALNSERPLEAFAASAVHWLLYGSLVLVPLSGWIHHAATTGFAPIWWPLGQNLPFVPKSEALANTAAGLHIVFERVLVAALFLHIAGALKHHFVDRDVTLKRMLPVAFEVPQIKKEQKSWLPAGAAISVWVAAIAIGGTLGVYTHAAERPKAAALENVVSDWQVQSGTLRITVTQLGSDVSGAFSDWTAAISYSPEIEDGVAGNVVVTVSIGSLTLGSVTNQALGPDYFDVTIFPTATLSADIVRDADGHRLTGQLRIRDKEVPINMPFELVLNGSLAIATGRTVLDRRDFGIGLSQSDAGTLGFEVVVDVALEAMSPV